MTEKSPTFKNASLWSVLNGVATRGLSFVFFVLMSRSLSPADMGLMALVLSISAIADTTADAGLSEAIIRDKTNSKLFLRAVMTLQGSISFIFFIASFPLGILFSYYSKSSEIVWLLPAVAVASFLNTLGLCPQAILKKDLRFREITVRNLAGTLIGGIVGLCAAYLDAGVWSLVLMHISNALTGLIVCSIAAKWIPIPTKELSILSSVKNFALSMTGTRLIEACLGRFDQLVVGSLFGTTALGYYSLAMKLYDVLFQVLCVSLSDVLFSRLSSLRDEKAKFMQVFLQSIRLQALIGPVTFVLVLLVCSNLLPEIFGNQWIDAKSYIEIILSAGAIQSFVFIHTLTLVANGNVKARFSLALTSASLWIVTLTALSRFGSTMSAFAWALRVTLITIAQLWLLKRQLKLSLRAYFSAVIPGLTVSIAVIFGYYGTITMTNETSSELSTRIVGILIGIVSGLFLVPLLFSDLRLKIIEKMLSKKKAFATTQQ